MRLPSKRFFRSERTRLLLLIVSVLLFIIAVLTHFHVASPILSEASILDAADANRVPAPPPDIPSSGHQPRKCGHVVLFSSARHGSTWFIDSVERCRYSASSHKTSDELFASTVFKHTEPWKHNTSALFKLSGSQVAAYVVNNSSVKVFSSTLQINRPGVEELVREGAKLHVPFVILRREPEATFKSLRLALETGVWNGVADRDVSNVTEMERFAKYKQGIDRYFGRIEDILKQAGVRDFDIVDYDKIKNLKYIRLERSGCYIRNCNFAD